MYVYIYIHTYTYTHTYNRYIFLFVYVHLCIEENKAFKGTVAHQSLGSSWLSKCVTSAWMATRNQSSSLWFFCLGGQGGGFRVWGFGFRVYSSSLFVYFFVGGRVV